MNNLTICQVTCGDGFWEAPKAFCDVGYVLDASLTEMTTSEGALSESLAYSTDAVSILVVKLSAGVAWKC